MADVNRDSSPMEPPPLGNAANTYKKQTDGVVSSSSDRESVLEVGLSAEEDRRLLRKIDLWYVLRSETTPPKSHDLAHY